MTIFTDPLRAATGVITLDVNSFFYYGSDDLIIKGNSIQWHTTGLSVPPDGQSSAPGRAGGQNIPTSISTTLSGVPALTGFLWTPEWPYPVPNPISGNAVSSVFTGLTPALPSADMTVELAPASNPGSNFGITIKQAPTAGNDYTLIVNVDSINSTSGSRTIRLIVTRGVPDLTPVLAPAPAIYSYTQRVKILDARPDATIYYTVDGTPATPAATKYTGPIAVTWDASIRAIATFPDARDSLQAAGDYRIERVMKRPVFSAPSGMYAAPQSIVLTADPSYCDHAICNIYYTLNDAIPNAGSPKYTGPIVLSAGGTHVINAIATSWHFLPSHVATATYNLDGPLPTRTGLDISGGAGNYTLTADVSGRGFPAPSGIVQFVDQSAGNAVVASQALDTGMASPVLRLSSGTSAGGFRAAVGDFNHDGRPDFVTVPASQDIFLGNGDGTFTPFQAFHFLGPFGSPGGSAFVDLASADFNGDGLLDLAAITAYAGLGGDVEYVQALLAHADGTFTLGQSYPLPVGDADTLSVADFNGDGKPDFATGNHDSSNRVAVFLGIGDGTFSPTFAPTAVSNPELVVSGDFNGDGVPDIASGGNDGSWSVSLGRGDGSFEAGPAYSAGDRIRQIAAADFNGDNRADIVVTTNNGVEVLLAQRDGTFVRSDALNTFPVSIATGDFNGDGKADILLSILVGSSETYEIAVWLGDGAGTFRLTPTNKGDGGTLVVGDFNLDGVADFLRLDYPPYPSAIYLGELDTRTSVSGVGFPGIGTHSVIARYSGDATHLPSDSAPRHASNQTGAPMFHPPSGTYGFTQMVTLESPTPGADIFYTLDGTTPTIESERYTGPVPVGWEATFRAFALAAGAGASSIATAAYEIDRPLQAPVFNPAPGEYNGTLTVSLATTSPYCEQSVCAIYYTTDGTEPTVASPKYRGPLTMSAPRTAVVRAIAAAWHFTSSSIVTATYNLR